MWHVSSRSGVATLRTAIHLLLLLTYLPNGISIGSAVLARKAHDCDQQTDTHRPHTDHTTSVYITRPPLCTPCMRCVLTISPGFARDYIGDCSVVVVVVVTFFNHNFVNCKATLIWRLKIDEIKYNISLPHIH